MQDLPRRRHYAEFYGLAEPRARDGRPTLWVHGNCQAESLRLQLEAEDVHTVRVPPVHELDRSDLPHLARLAARTEVLVTQPVRGGYRGLPLGHEEIVASLYGAARVVRVPVIRFAGLHPTHAIVRPPEDPSLSPPLVAYHDLATLVRADDARRSGRTRAPAPAGTSVTVAQVRAVAAHSVRELRRREEHHDTVPVSDLFGSPRFTQMRTLNHPGNEMWQEVAVRVRVAAELDPALVRPLARPLLDSVHAPRRPEVADAFGLDRTLVDPDWHVQGERLSVGTVAEAHLAWYAAHPGAVDAGLQRHREVLGLLGLAA